MTITALDAADRVEQLISLTQTLTERLRAETAAFKARKPQSVASSSAETARLANIYRHESARVRADPTLVAGAPQGRRARLIELTRTFETVLAAHGAALSAAKTVTEGVVQAIAEEVARQRSAVAGYGPMARGRQGDGSAIALNRRA